MSRIFGAGGFAAIAAVGQPDGIFCALCSGLVDMRGQLHVASMRAICGYCFEANRDTARLASRLAALDEQERRAHELRSSEPVRPMGDQAITSYAASPDGLG